MINPLSLNRLLPDLRTLRLQAPLLRARRRICVPLATGCGVGHALIVFLLLTQTRPICICMRGLFTLRREGAGQCAENIQIQARGGVGARVMFRRFDIARVLLGLLDLLLGGGGFGELVGWHDDFS